MEEQNNEQTTYEAYLEELGNTEFVEKGLEKMKPEPINYDEKIKEMLE